MNYKTIKVCHVLTLTRLGGVERMFLDYIEHQVQNVTLANIVVSTSISDQMRQILDSYKIKYYVPKRLFRYDIFSIIKIYFWLKKQNPNIIHSYNTSGNILGAILKLFLRNPKNICSEHGTVWIQTGIKKWIEKIFYKSSNLIIVNSKASKLMLEERYNVQCDKIQVLYNGVPYSESVKEEKNNLLRMKSSQKIIGTVGRLDTPKNIFTFLEAAQSLTRIRDDVIFYIIGGGILENELKNKAIELKIDDKCFFLGWRKDARQLIAQFDIYLCTSIRESLGNSIIEACFLAKPVVAPMIDGITEILNNETGILLKPCNKVYVPLTKNCSQIPDRIIINNNLVPPKALDPEEISETINNLLNDPERSNIIGDFARRNTVSKFSMDLYCSNLINTYNNLLN